ncbi:MAG TPA: cation-transporting P-type ATPase [Streptosporangiaceae bacterium]|nr:cation-transporting P-type ATPase [Streptosporangiaceae bacterium]
MTTPTGAPPSGLASGGDGTAWHALSTDSVLRAEQVDEREGLSSAEVQARTQRFGPNKFDSGKTESRWHAFIRQSYR